MKRSVLEWLESSAAQYPDRPAFGDVDGDITFSQLLCGAKAAGTALADKIGKNQPVAFYLEKSNLAMQGMLGAVYAGGFYSVVDVRQPQPRAEATLKTLEATVLVTDGKFLEKAKELSFSGQVLLLEDLLHTAINDEKLAAIRDNACDTDPLYVNFTSGSTGIPKGVTICHRSVLEFIEVFTETFGITSEDVIGNQAPFDFDVSVKDIYSGLKTGAKVQIIPREYFSIPTKLMDYLCDHKVTTLIWAVSAMCFVSVMGGFAYRCPETIRRVMFSGEVMPIPHLNKWRKYLPDAMYVNLYGPTEITCNCTYHILDREYDVKEVLPIGRPFKNETVFLLDEQDHQVCTADSVGELCVSGTSLALGYYRNWERTKQVFVQNPLNDKYIELIYRTGDLAKYNEAGELVYVGRKDFQIKHMGHRIELGEIEVTAGACEGVSRACCIYRAEKSQIVLFYTGTCEEKALKAMLMKELPQAMIPNIMRHVDAMPMNKNGKIDRNALLAGLG